MVHKSPIVWQTMRTHGYSRLDSLRSCRFASADIPPATETISVVTVVRNNSPLEVWLHNQASSCRNQTFTDSSHSTAVGIVPEHLLRSGYRRMYSRR